MYQDPDKKIFDAVAMTADVDTAALGTLINLGHRTHLCVQFESNGGDHVGVLYVQGRIYGATNWQTLASYTVSSGSAVDEVLDMSDLGVEEIRLFFDRTSGTTGTLSAWWVSKRGAR